ncbi:glycosyltransferase [Methanobacterium oryzae]|uniref:glycosyltransferase n=1 Tax=Methanobacterium oryzae TaxID=69540 RepID=UPI003D245DC7
MKILQITPVYYPAISFGGIVEVVYHISTILTENGHEVTVYTTDADKKARIKVNNLNNVYYFRNISNVLAWKFRLFLPIKMYYYMWKNMENYDVIHIHDFRTLITVMAVYFARKRNIPCILEPHGSITSDISQRSMKIIFDLFFSKMIISSCDKILALNETEKQKCIEKGASPENIEIVPNGINLKDYIKLPNKGKFRELYGLKDEKILLYLGRIHESKGLDILIRAFSELSKLSNINLVIVGPDDGHLSHLKKLCNELEITDKVLFTGPIFGKNKLSAYVDADIFVTPLFYGFPLTFLESMACGIPIITTNNGDYICGINNKIGYVVHDLKGLEDAIYKILIDDKLKLKLSKNAKKEITKYDWSVITKNIEKIYFSLLN